MKSLSLVLLFLLSFGCVEENNSTTSDSSQAKTGPWPHADKDAALANNLLASNYYIVFDGSGSMDGTGCSNGRSKVEVAKDATKTFINLIPESANVGLFVFDDRGVSERAPLRPNDSQNKTDLLGKVDSISANGGTPLSDALKTAYISIEAQGRSQLGYGDYNIVVVTDGEANSEYDLNNVVRQILSNSPVVIHTIGFCIGESHSLNRKGEVLYKPANSPEELKRGFESVLAELDDFQVNDF